MTPSACASQAARTDARVRFSRRLALLAGLRTNTRSILGASYNGTRLGRLVSPSITIDDALELLRPMIKRYALERNEAEGFGDFCDRVILPAGCHDP